MRIVRGWIETIAQLNNVALASWISLNDAIRRI